MQFSYPVLLADIGGTNCRLAMVDAPGSAPVPLLTLASADIADVPLRLRDVMNGRNVRSAVLAVAGVVDQPRVTFTNLPWTIDASAIGEALALDAVWLVNDFEAQAAALAVLDEADILTLQRGDRDANGTRLIVGAGTGFGTAYLHPAPHGFCIISGEGGHVDLPLMPGDEELFATQLRKRHGRLGVESVVSGPGLSRLDAVLMPRMSERSPEDIGAAAQSGEEQALLAIAIWFRLLACAVANLVIATKATGGAWIAGGMITRLLPFLDHETFITNATDKPPMTILMQRTPLHIVTRTDSAFPGLAALTADPLRFGISNPPGLWQKK